MKCDLHVHSKYSVDSDVSMSDYCKRAVALGIDCIAFTDHVDHNPVDYGYNYFKESSYFKSCKNIAKKYNDRLEVLTAVEFSEPHSFSEEFKKLSDNPLDFIMGSLHIWYNNLFVTQMMEQNIPMKDCYKAYWQQMYEMVSYGGFDVVGHFDFPKRYYGDVVYNESEISDIFKVMVKNNIVPEINTSSVRQGQSEGMPGRDILKIYAQAGGKYFTTGSDSHFLMHLYNDIDDVKKTALSLGLTQVIFRNRKLCIV